MRDFKKNTGKWGRTLLFFLILAVLLGGISRKNKDGGGSGKMGPLPE